MGHRRDNRSDITVTDANTLARCRQLLGDEAGDLSDEEIDHIRRHADALARVIVAMYVAQRAVQGRH